MALVSAMLGIALIIPQCDGLRLYNVRYSSDNPTLYIEMEFCFVNPYFHVHISDFHIHRNLSVSMSERTDQNRDKYMLWIQTHACETINYYSIHIM